MCWQPGRRGLRRAIRSRTRRPHRGRLGTQAARAARCSPRRRRRSRGKHPAALATRGEATPPRALPLTQLTRARIARSHWPAHSQSALVQGMPSGRREGLRRQTRAATVDKGKTSHLFCGNNALSPKLKQNGGTMVEGKPSECFRKGFGAGFHQHIPPERLEEFLADFSSPYRRLIEQPIYYGDGPVPEGLFRATLSQSRARGFGVGSMQLAKKILRERGRAGPNDTRR